MLIKLHLAFTLILVLATETRSKPNIRGDRKSAVVEWFEAKGPDDDCDLAKINEEESNNNNNRRRRGELPSHRSSSICQGAFANEARCSCVKRVNSMGFELECGVCLDPCALRFVPLTNTGEFGANNENARLDLVQSKEEEDLKNLLLHRFLKDVLHLGSRN